MIDGRSRLRRLSERLKLQYGDPAWPKGDPLTELVRAILSQSTTDQLRDIALGRLRARFPSWEAAARADTATVEELIRPAGLYSQKAAAIKAALAQVQRDWGRMSLDGLAALGDDEAMAYLTAFPGVGPKTAACALLFGLGRPVFPVDTHVHRLAGRLGLSAAATPARVQGDLQVRIPPEEVYPLHINLVRHGREVCRPVPRCVECFLAAECRHAAPGQDQVSRPSAGRRQGTASRRPATEPNS